MKMAQFLMGRLGFWEDNVLVEGTLDVSITPFTIYILFFFFCVWYVFYFPGMSASTVCNFLGFSTICSGSWRLNQY